MDQPVDQFSLLKSHIDAYTKNDGTTVKAHETRIEAHGVKGMKSTPWRKEFKSEKHLDDWMTKQDGNAELHGVREMEQSAPAAKPAAMPPVVRAAINELSPTGDHEWTHSDGESKLTVGRSRAHDSPEVLYQHGFRFTGGDHDEMKHPDGHMATIKDSTLTIKHGGK
jgi:hypothetical protein